MAVQSNPFWTSIFFLKKGMVGTFVIFTISCWYSMRQPRSLLFGQIVSQTRSLAPSCSCYPFYEHFDKTYRKCPIVLVLRALTMTPKFGDPRLALAIPAGTWKLCRLSYVSLRKPLCVPKAGRESCEINILWHRIRLGTYSFRRVSKSKPIEVAPGISRA